MLLIPIISFIGFFVIVAFLVDSGSVKTSFFNLSWITALFLYASAFFIDKDVYITALSFENLFFYLIIGFLWSIFRWAVKIKEFKKEYLNFKKDIIEKFNINEEEWLENFDDGTFTMETASPVMRKAYRQTGTFPHVEENIEFILITIFFWWASFINWFYSRFIMDLVISVFEKMKESYNKITKQLTQDISEDF
jgi:hypothetical protein